MDKILVIKHGALGDIVQAFDAFASLRAGNQKAHITLMTSTGFFSFATMMPWFDEVIVDAGMIAKMAAIKITLGDFLPLTPLYLADPRLGPKKKQPAA